MHTVKDYIEGERREEGLLLSFSFVWGASALDVKSRIELPRQQLVTLRYTAPAAPAAVVLKGSTRVHRVYAIHSSRGFIVQQAR